MAKLWFVILVAGIDVVCVGAAESPADRETSREASKANFDAVWQYVKPAIFGSNKAVRLYYRANCHVIRDFVGQDPIPFPSVRVQPSSKGKTGLVALREIFKNDKSVAVTEDPAGIIRIRIGEVPTEILKTKLTRLNLNPLDQYNPDEALGEIITTEEMKSAMRSHRMSTVPTAASQVTEPLKGLPHLPISIRNVIAEDAIDRVAKTWAGEGIVIYGVCAGQTEPNGEKFFRLDYAGDLLPK